MVRTFTKGETVCWKMISGVDLHGNLIMGHWCTGEVIDHDPNDSGRILVRRGTNDRSVVSLAITQIE